MKVRKFKIVQHRDILTSYYWEKLFLFFGRWVPYKNQTSSDPDFAINQIKDIDKFINSIHTK